jgi:hypothetical protein
MIITGTRVRGGKYYGGTASAVTTDTYFNLVTLLLPGNGTNGAQNNTFVDSSTNNFAITRNGNTTQGTFSPFSQTGWSGYFDGSGDYLSAAGDTAFAMSTGDFTIEVWVWPVTISTYMPLVSQFPALTTGLGYYTLTVNGSRNVELYYDGQTYATLTSATVTMNEWNHVAIVRSGSTITGYINGSVAGTITYSGVFGSSSTALEIGGSTRPGGNFWANAFISNVRLVKGTAVYTSTFTPPTAPLTAISGTSLLTCQSNRFIDNSTNAFAITPNGNTAVQAFSPFDPATAYAAGTVGGSAYFDGTGDYLSVPDNSGFDLDSTFTLEGWFYQPLAGDGIIFSRGGGGASWSTTNGQEYWANILSGSFYWQWNSSGSPAEITATAPAAGAWHHFAVGYNGTTTRLWIDGVSAGTSTSNYTLPTTRNITRVGLSSFASSPFTGYISSLRVIKGTDVYGVGNTSITVPTAPVTAIANTQLLLNYTNAGITDAAAKNVFETVDGAQISTAQSKWGGSSMAFDGSGDYVIEPTSLNYGYGTGDFTIEFWLYLNSTGLQTIISQLSSNPQVKPHIYYSSGVKLYVNGADVITGGTLTVSTWNHIAVSKSGSSTKLFINGTQSGSTYTDTNNYGTTSPLIIADYGFPTPTGANQLNGYINDLRITKGYARYTANFTPPTAAFPTQ